MKLKRIIALAAFSIVICTSCKNTLNVQAPYKDVTVVYGLMDQSDAVHYIRINKGFEGNGNAYTMAQQYDSLYYPVGEISAVLEDSNPNTGNIVSATHLDTTTTIPMPPGTFSYPKQLLYYTNQTLNPADYYLLIITNNVTGKKIKGSTALLSDLSFNPTLNNHTKPLSLGSEPYPGSIGWLTSPNARIYQMTLEFYYDNQVGSGPRVVQAPLQLVFAEQSAPNLAGGTSMNYTISEQLLFSLIISSLQYEPGVTRYADSLGVIFSSGTDDLNTYIQLSQPPSGINQDVPAFTDVKNGVGLYTARHAQTFYKAIDPSTIDSLTQEARFVNLGFQL